MFPERMGDEKCHRPALPELLLIGGFLCCTLTFVPPSVLWTGGFFLPKELVLETIAAAAAIAVTTSRRTTLGRSDIVLACGWLLGLVSLLAHRPVLDDGLRAFGALSSALVLLWATRQVIGRRAGCDDPGRTLRAGSIVIMAVIAAMMLGEAYGAWQIAPWQYAPGGTIGNRNRAAHLLALLLPVLWATMQLARRRAMVLALVAVSIAAGAALTLSRTRAAWLPTLLLAALCIPTMVGRYTRTTGLTLRAPRTLLLLAGLATGAVVGALLPNQLEWVEGSSRGATAGSLRRLVDFRTGSGAGRVLQYRTSVPMILRDPLLGVGPGRWSRRYLELASPDDPSVSETLPRPVDRLPQSDWLVIATELGLPALIALALGVVGLAGPTNRRTRTDDLLRSVSAAARVGVLIVIAIIGSLDLMIFTPEGAFGIALTLGALIPSATGAIAGHAPLHSATPRRLSRCRVVVGGTMALTLSVTLWRTVQIARANHMIGNWLRPVTRVDRVRRAVEIAPGDYMAQYVLARYWVQQGQCDEARSPLRAAEAIFPHAPQLARLASGCSSAAGTDAR